MKKPVEIKIQIDPKCHDPVIVIRTDRKTQAVENIVHAIEACADSGYPLIAGYRDSEMELLSQRDIVRVYVESRKVRICTDDGTYDSGKNLSGPEIPRIAPVWPCSAEQGFFCLWRNIRNEGIRFETRQVNHEKDG